MTLQELKTEATRLLADYRHLGRRVKEEREAERAARQSLDATTKARDAIQTLAAAVQRQAHEQVEGIVSKAVGAVYPGGYTFHIDFVKRRGKTEADLYFRKGELRLDPADGVGQGMVDVAAFALRLVALRLSRPKPRQLLIADEPFKAVNGEGNRRRCALLVETLSKDLEIQVIIATGLEWLSVGKVVRLSGGGTPATRTGRRG